MPVKDLRDFGEAVEARSMKAIIDEHLRPESGGRQAEIALRPLHLALVEGGHPIRWDTMVEIYRLFERGKFGELKGSEQDADVAFRFHDPPEDP
jgi:hypothetical protein